MAEDRERSSEEEPKVDAVDSVESADADPPAAAEASEGAIPAEAAAPKTATGSTPSAEASTKGRRLSKLWWALPILMLVEFYVYGHNGRLEVCVGKEGDTDFSLVGAERTDENRWKFPRCETRLNLGLRSERELRVEEATKVACRGATIFRHQGEGKACVAGEKGWVHQVEGHFVPPWDPAYYQHLFWFLQ